MKSLFLFSSLLLLTSQAQAFTKNFKFVGVNESEATTLCLTAASEGLEAAKTLAAQSARYSVSEFYSTTCNGENISRFSKKYQKQTSNVEKAVKTAKAEYQFKALDNNDATLLCTLAAEQGFQAVLQQQGYKAKSIYCNGMQIQRFARRFNKA